MRSEKEILEEFKSEKSISLGFCFGMTFSSKSYSNIKGKIYPLSLNNKLDELFKENFIQINFSETSHHLYFEYGYFINISFLTEEKYELRYKYGRFTFYKIENNKVFRTALLPFSLTRSKSKYLHKKIILACVLFIDKIPQKDLLKLRKDKILNEISYTLLKEYKKTKDKDTLASLNLIIECED